MMNFYRKTYQIMLLAGLVGTTLPSLAADFVIYPDPSHLAAKLSPTVSTDDVVAVDENTVRLVSTKINPSLLVKAENMIESLAERIDETLRSTSNEFERKGKIDKVRQSIQAESAAVDLSKTFMFEFETDLEKMTPEKLCVKAPTQSSGMRYFTEGRWPVNYYRFYTGGQKEFEYYCANNVEEAQKFEEKMNATDYRKVAVQIYAKVLPAIYNEASRGAHLYFVPYLVKVSNTKNQSPIFEIKR